jgi:hypothetical protein
MMLATILPLQFGILPLQQGNSVRIHAVNTQKWLRSRNVEVDFGAMTWVTRMILTEATM